MEVFTNECLDLFFCEKRKQIIGAFNHHSTCRMFAMKSGGTWPVSVYGVDKSHTKKHLWEVWRGHNCVNYFAGYYEDSNGKMTHPGDGVLTPLEKKTIKELLEVCKS